MVKGLLVEDLKSGKIIGYLPVDESNQTGGVVSDIDGHNVVGVIQTGVAQGEYVLRANQPWHTGRRYDGNSVLWAHRPTEVKS